MSLKVGIAGFGKMGKIRYEALLKDPRTQVVAVSDPFVEELPKDVKVFKTPEELIASPIIDAVVICTPNNLNKKLTILALQNNKHVFCEKPPAFTKKDMEEIRAVEKSMGKLKLMYGFNHRHHDSIIHAKKLVDSGQYGKVLWMRGRYGKSVDANFYKNWRSDKAQVGGGILIDQGIHMLDLFLMFAGEFDEVKAFISHLYWNLPVEDNVFAIFRNKNGVVASLHSTMTQWRHLFSIEIFLESGYIVLNGLLTSSKTYGEEILTVAKNRSVAPAATWSDEEHIHFKVDNSWQYEVLHFVDCITENKPVQHGTSLDSLKIIDLIERVYKDDASMEQRPEV